MSKRRQIELTATLSKRREVKITRYQYRVNTKVTYSFDFKSRVTGSVYSVNGLSKEELKELKIAIEKIDKEYENL